MDILRYQSERNSLDRASNPTAGRLFGFSDHSFGEGDMPVTPMGLSSGSAAPSHLPDFKSSADFWTPVPGGNSFGSSEAFYRMSDRPAEEAHYTSLVPTSHSENASVPGAGDGGKPENSVSDSFYTVGVHLCHSTNPFATVKVPYNSSLALVRHVLGNCAEMALNHAFFFVSPTGIVIDDAQENDIYVEQVMEAIPMPVNQSHVFAIFIEFVDQTSL